MEYYLAIRTLKFIFKVPERLVLVCSGYHNNIPQTRWLKAQIIFSHSSGGWNFEIKVSASLGLPLACKWPSFHHVLTWSFLCAHVFLVSLTLLIRKRVLLDLGPTLMTSFGLNYLIKDPISTYRKMRGG